MCHSGVSVPYNEKKRESDTNLCFVCRIAFIFQLQISSNNPLHIHTIHRCFKCVKWFCKKCILLKICKALFLEAKIYQLCDINDKIAVYEEARSHFICGIQKTSTRLAYSTSSLGPVSATCFQYTSFVYNFFNAGIMGMICLFSS